MLNVTHRSVPPLAAFVFALGAACAVGAPAAPAPAVEPAPAAAPANAAPAAPPAAAATADAADVAADAAATADAADVAADAAATADAADVAADAAAPQAPPRPTLADSPVDEGAYGERRNCISLSDIEDHKALDDRHIVFKLRHGRYVLSQLRQRCNELRHSETISLNTVGGSTRVCSMDSINVLEQGLGYSRGFGTAEEAAGFRVVGRCALGPFETISKEQFEALQQAMDAEDHERGSFWDWVTGDSKAR